MSANLADPSTLMVRTLEILWHCNERTDEAEVMGLQSCIPEGITSIDWNTEGTRLLTTGGDRCVRMWSIDTKSLKEWIDDSTKDMTACLQHVCCMKSTWMPMTARWSPHGHLVATAHCDGKICLWWQERKLESNDVVRDESGEEIWKDFRHLSGHVNDVYDICFSPDSRYLLSGGGDGSVLVHDLEGSTMPVVQLSDCHTKFCRGVAWDPWNRFLVTFGGGPPLQFFTHVPKRITDNRVRRMSVAGQRKCQGDFVGDTCQLFFRRMSWSPDGTLLAVPFGKAGHLSQLRRQASEHEAAQPEGHSPEGGSCGEPDMIHCVYLYARNALEKVAARIVIKGYSEIRGVAWAPCFLERQKPNTNGVIHPFFQAHLQRTQAKVEVITSKETGLWGPESYAMALAAWTPDAVIVYTTESTVRHSDFTDLHMRSITDVAWAPDASYLLTAGLDGYVSVIAFRKTLSRTHRLPIFSSSPAVRSMCDVFKEISSQGGEVENSYSKLAERSTAQTSVAAVVKKKKKVESSSPTSAKSEITEEQLFDLISST